METANNETVQQPPVKKVRKKSAAKKRASKKGTAPKKSPAKKVKETATFLADQRSNMIDFLKKCNNTELRIFRNRVLVACDFAVKNPDSIAQEIKCSDGAVIDRQTAINDCITILKQLA